MSRIRDESKLVFAPSASKNEGGPPHAERTLMDIVGNDERLVLRALIALDSVA
jgi:hypothetical protein